MVKKLCRLPVMIGQLHWASGLDYLLLPKYDNGYWKT
jgi:hypothetical protein